MGACKSDCLKRKVIHKRAAPSRKNDNLKK
jgi:hypothetical protein